jgi:hypothetical protein
MQTIINKINNLDEYRRSKKELIVSEASILINYTFTCSECKKFNRFVFTEMPFNLNCSYCKTEFSLSGKTLLCIRKVGK